MITLSDVKINNSYTYYKSVAPTVTEKAPSYIVGQTWINTLTGISYMLMDSSTGTWTQIESAEDFKITNKMINVFKNVIRSLSNYFIIDRNEEYEGDYPDTFSRAERVSLSSKECIYGKSVFTATDKKITVDAEYYGDIASIKKGDTILVSRSKRNDAFYTVSDITGNVITVTESIVDDSSYCFISLCDIPQEVIQIVARMVYFDVYTRPSTAGMQSETIGSYSYTVKDSSSGILNYPSDITAGLDAYELIPCGGIAYYVD